MNLLLAVAVGAMFTMGLYQVMGKDLLRIAFGIYILFNGANLVILTVGTLPGSTAPFVSLGGSPVDPLVQAMVLTAIVIGFGLATFLLLLAARLGRDRRSLDATAMTRWRR
ncbi:MAG: NADH-quinone oxidoreductase subunit K [Candidatus Sericytochromatia bacterium]|nr:NADH-quinone oxidoreductase subunit K [Candidatus Tanganyikabacteria bacterium]